MPSSYMWGPLCYFMRDGSIPSWSGDEDITSSCFENKSLQIEQHYTLSMSRQPSMYLMFAFRTHPTGRRLNVKNNGYTTVVAASTTKTAIGKRSTCLRNMNPKTECRMC